MPMVMQGRKQCAQMYLVALGKNMFGDIGELGDCPASIGILHGIQAVESHKPLAVCAVQSLNRSVVLSDQC